MTTPPERCHWCSADPDYIAYHDHEWGVPLRDPQRLFELLVLEGFQAGLAWITVLKKRPRLRQRLFAFDAQQLAQMSDAAIEDCLQDAGIIRNRLKLRAARQNARAWLAQEDPVALLWSFVDGVPQVNHFDSHAQIPTQTPAAVAMSRALKAAGFSFVGPTICYAFMQAAGMVMDHTRNCHRYAALAGSPPD